MLTLPYIAADHRATRRVTLGHEPPARTNAYNADVRRAVSEHRRQATVIDLNRMLDPAGVYTASVSGVDVRWSDGVHISLDGGELLRRRILPVVDRMGMEDEAARSAA